MIHIRRGFLESDLFNSFGPVAGVGDAQLGSLGVAREIIGLLATRRAIAVGKKEPCVVRVCGS